MKLENNNCPSCGSHSWENDNSKPAHRGKGRRHVICTVCGFQAQATANRIFLTIRTGAGKTAHISARVRPETKAAVEISGFDVDTLLKMGLIHCSECVTIAV